MIFLSDASAKNYGAGSGNYFSFGDMTEDLKTYIETNRFALYGVVPDRTKDLTLLPDKVSKIVPFENTSLFYMKNGDVLQLGDSVLAATLPNGEKMFPQAASNIGGIKEVIQLAGTNTFYLMNNGTVKYVPDGSSIITTLPGISSITKAICNSSQLCLIDSNGKAFQVYSDGQVTAFNNPFMCDRVAFISYSGMLFIAADGTPYMRYTIYDNIYKTYSYGFTQARIRNRQSGTLSYLGAIKDAVSYRPSTTTSDYPVPVVVQYQSDLIRQFVGITSEREDTGRYVYWYPELWLDPAYNIDETGVDRIESTSRSILIHKKNGTVKMLTNDIKIYEKEKYTELRKTLVNVPLTNIKNTFLAGANKYYITDSNNITYQYDLDPNSPDPVMGTNLVSLGELKGVFSCNGLWSRVNIYQLRNDGNVREIIYGRSGEIYYVSSDKILPYKNIKEIYTSGKTIFLLDENGRVYGTGNTEYGQLGYKYNAFYIDNFVTPIATTLTFDTTKKYLSLLDIFKGTASSGFYPSGQYTAALNSIYRIYENIFGAGTTYVILGDELEYQSAYSDYESDPEHSIRWQISHDPNYFDNSMGLSKYHNPSGFMTDPPAKLDKVGKYIINLKARDNPKNDLRFLSDTNDDKNYYKWSLGDQNLTVYVHRKPIALQRIAAEENGNGTYTVRAYDAGSYDIDHNVSRTDKGIAESEWRWKESSDMSWHYEQMNKTDCLPDRTYTIQLRVKDIEGVWSDYNTIETSNSRPVALFTIDRNPIFVEEQLLVRDQSFPQSLSKINRWHWIVKKYNDDDTLPSSGIQDGQYDTSNGGTGDMNGYDTNIKTEYSDIGPGKYRIYLRVRDSNGLWSDGGTNGSYDSDNLDDNFYWQDFEVQESFKMSDFRVVLIKDFRLEPYYNVNGRYPDKPMNVNSMAIDSENFIVGGYSIVPGFSSLTKGYIFEFEIDTTNFNEEADTVEIEPTFYAYYSGVPGIRGPQCDLYWIDSNKEIHKAGEGGHSSWERIVLDDGNRTITGETSATWRGEYLIPATSWLVPLGTTAANKINADIIVNFAIKGYKNGEEKFDYNDKQWPVERTIEKYPYEIGDVIRYDYTKSCLDDCSVIINRP